MNSIHKTGKKSDSFLPKFSFSLKQDKHITRVGHLQISPDQVTAAKESRSIEISKQVTVPSQQNLLFSGSPPAKPLLHRKMSAGSTARAQRDSLMIPNFAPRKKEDNDLQSNSNSMGLIVDQSFSSKKKRSRRPSPRKSKSLKVIEPEMNQGFSSGDSSSSGRSQFNKTSKHIEVVNALTKQKSIKARPTRKIQKKQVVHNLDNDPTFKLSDNIEKFSIQRARLMRKHTLRMQQQDQQSTHIFSAFRDEQHQSSQFRRGMSMISHGDDDLISESGRSCSDSQMNNSSASASERFSENRMSITLDRQRTDDGLMSHRKRRSSGLKSKTSFTLQRSATDILHDATHEEVKKQYKEAIKHGRGLGTKFVIRQHNLALQLWFIAQIILNFLSSFNYSYAAAFLPRFSQDDKDSFLLQDTLLQCVFFFDLALHFIIEYKLEKRVVVRDMRQIFLIRIKSARMWVDFLTIFPFSRVFDKYLSKDGYRLLFLIKVLRLEKAFLLFNTKSFQKTLKRIQSIRVQRIIKQSRKIAHSQISDQSKLQIILLISKIHKAVRLSVIILCISYFVGILWLILMDLSFEAVGDDNFIDTFHLKDRTPTGIAVLMTYFLFTSFSTVGLGDFHPRSSLERIVAAFVLMFGVMITSFVMNNFSYMLEQIKNFNAAFEESEKLNLFIGTLKRFNKNKDLPSKMVERLESYFKYRWEHNKDVVREEDSQLFKLLPRKIQRALYTDYLHAHFLEVYRTTFFIIKSRNKIRFLKRQNHRQISETMVKQSKLMMNSSLNMDMNNEIYQEFLISLLNCLEPKIVHRQVYQKQNQPVEEILFVMKGEFEVGYNHALLCYKENLGSSPQKMGLVYNNKRKSFVMRQEQRKYHYPLNCKEGQAIGFFEMCFEQKSQFAYRRKQEKNQGGKPVELFFLKRRNWRELLRLWKNDPQQKPIFEEFKTLLLLKYIDKVYLPIKQYQEEMIKLEKMQVPNNITLPCRKNDPENRLQRLVLILGAPKGSRKEVFASMSSQSRASNDGSSHSSNQEEEENSEKSVRLGDLVRKVSRCELTKVERQSIVRINEDKAISASNSIRESSSSCSSLNSLRGPSSISGFRESIEEKMIRLEEQLDMLVSQNQSLKLELEEKDAELAEAHSKNEDLKKKLMKQSLKKELKSQRSAKAHWQRLGSLDANTFNEQKMNDLPAFQKQNTMAPNIQINNIFNMSAPPVREMNDIVGSMQMRLSKKQKSSMDPTTTINQNRGMPHRDLFIHEEENEEQSFSALENSLRLPYQSSKQYNGSSENEPAMPEQKQSSRIEIRQLSSSSSSSYSMTSYSLKTSDGAAKKDTLVADRDYDKDECIFTSQPTKKQSKWLHGEEGLDIIVPRSDDESVSEEESSSLQSGSNPNIIGITNTTT